MDKEQEGFRQKKALGIGGNGFSGSSITRLIPETGQRLKSRSRDQTSKLFPSDVEVVRCNLLYLSHLENA